MIENPDPSPAEPETLPDQPRRRLRSYHVPFLIAVVCGLALAVISSITFADRQTFGVCFGVICAILVFDIPVCVLVLWEFMRTGEPPQLSLEPFFLTAERRSLYRAWKERAQLDDNAFYRTFYADSGIAPTIVLDVRREMQRIFERSLAGLHPGDDLLVAEPEMDFADVFDELSESLGVVIPWRTEEIPFDGTFDSLVRVVAACKARKEGTSSAAEKV